MVVGAVVVAMRRRAGVGKLLQKKREREKAAAKGQQIEDQRLEHVEKVLGEFKEHLEQFASRHRDDINKDPEFRRQFQRMTQEVGVDPLASNKGFWGEILGVGDFYYDVAVQIVDICLQTRDQNGGLIDIRELGARLAAKRGRHAASVSRDDMERAIKKLGVLGSGFKIVPVGARVMVVSVPYELNRDHSTVLSLAESKGYVTKSQLQRANNWPTSRVDRVLGSMLRVGMAWIDDQAGKERQFWFPSVWTSRHMAADAS